jgi:selenide, water dikinase
MGGEPIFAINLAAYPDGYGMELLTEILRGGAEKVREAGAAIAGGHTVTDKEPKYGLAVTGLVHPNRLFTKGGIRPGDQLILTKPLGVGVITTALKNSRATDAEVSAAVQSMKRLNKTAAALAKKYGVLGVTDVTGYSLLGHAHEMAHLSGVDLYIDYTELTWLPGAQQHAKAGGFPGGMGRNRAYFSKWVHFDDRLSEWQQDLLYDPQTSGGLLIAAAPDFAPELLSALVAAGEEATLIGRADAGQGLLFVG